MKRIVVHIEGGRSRTDDGEFRKAFHTFFKELADLAQTHGIGFKCILEGSREETYTQFCLDARRDTEALHVLLVDSEEAVKEVGQPWRYLKETDRWDCPPGADDSQCHLMVMAMEAWFFADPETLKEFYGQGFNANALPKRQNVEQISKASHLSSLKVATRNTPKGEYHKFRHAPLILERLNVSKVRARAPHCDRLFTTLIAKIQVAR